MKKIVRLTAADLARIVRRVIKEQPNEISVEEIISLLINTAEDIPTEDYEDLYDWMNVIFSQVEDILEDKGVDIDDLRMDYDYVLMSMWDKDEDEF